MTSMTGMAVLCISLAAGPWPTLERCLDSEPLALIEIPDASRSLQTLERSSFRRWIPLLLGEDANVIRGASLRLISAWYGTASGGAPDLVLGADAQRESEAVRDIMARWWTQLGMKAAGVSERDGWKIQTLNGEAKRVTVAAHAERGRVGWALDASRASRLGEAHSPSLAEDEAFRAMVSYAPRADLRGLVHVPRAFGWLLKQSQGDVAARLIGRLGLAGMQMTPFAVELHNRREARIVSETRLRGDTRGAVSALGPPLAVQWPSSVPEDARGFVTASVVPAQVLRAAYFFMSADNPLRLTLLQAQIAALESEIGKSLDRDVLGLEPKRWTVFVEKKGAAVARIELADSLAAEALVKALFKAYPSIAPEAAQWGEVRGFRVREGSRRPVIAFAPDAVWLATNEAALERTLAAVAPEEAPAMLLGGRAVLYGQGDDFLRGLARVLNLPAPSERTTDRSAFRVEREDDRFGFFARLRR